jgi:hypothetical protein
MNSSGGSGGRTPYVAASSSARASISATTAGSAAALRSSNRAFIDQCSLETYVGLKRARRTPSSSASIRARSENAS